MTRQITADEIETGDVIDQDDPTTGSRRMGIVVSTDVESDLPGDIRVQYRYDDQYDRTPYNETCHRDELDHPTVDIFRSED